MEMVMKRLITLALAVATAIGCRDSTDPRYTTPLAGTYNLTAIDGHALPYDVTISGETKSVAGGDLEFSPFTILSLTLGVGTPGNPAFQVIAVSGQYRRATADSVVFPAVASPELFARRTGSTVILVTQPAGTGFAEALGGAHRFTFVGQP
jgi:hypothetical protein